MSTVTRLVCAICNPEENDVNGIRRVVSVSSQELAELIRHVATAHVNKPEVVDEYARAAADAAQACVATLARIIQTPPASDVPYEVPEGPAV